MVVKVRFPRASKLYDFDTNGLELSTGVFIVTETVRGIEVGECMSDMREVSEKQRLTPLKPIYRIATEEDLRIRDENIEKEKEALILAEKKVREMNLDMRLVDVEYAFDRSKITFYFTAEGRVDFRNLVKNLAGVFRTRIELRQIGVRDEAKMLGGLGPCGRPICCRQFLLDFQPVSIRMAKEQNLSLNPTKISGICDRLMCCLKYEQDQYEATRKKMPKVGKEIDTPDGRGTISEINVLSETVKVRLPVGDSYEFRTYSIEDCVHQDENGTTVERVLKPQQKRSMDNEFGLGFSEEADSMFDLEEEESAQIQLSEASEESDSSRARRNRRRHSRKRHASGKQQNGQDAAQGQEKQAPVHAEKAQNEKPKAEKPKAEKAKPEKSKGERAQGNKPQPEKAQSENLQEEKPPKPKRKHRHGRGKKKPAAQAEGSSEE